LQNKNQMMLVLVLMLFSVRYNVTAAAEILL